MKEKVLQLIADETGNPAEESTRIDALGVDSLEFLELLQVLEQATGRRVPDAAISKMETVGELIAALEAVA